MSTPSSARNLFPPLDNPELTIQKRSRADPTLLNDFEMAAEGNDDPPVPDLRTMEELCQPFLNGRGGPIASIAIQATNFGLKNDMIQQVKNSCQFYGLPGDDANKHLDKFLHLLMIVKFVVVLIPTMIVHPPLAKPKTYMLREPIKEDLKGITTRSGTAYQGPTIPTISSSLPPIVERETEATKDTVHPTNNRSTKDVQPPVVQAESPIQNSEPVVAPVSASKPNLKPLIPYPSRLYDQKLRDKANDQKEKFFQIFKDLHFSISFGDALILMPKFGPTIKTLLTNKDKLSELARTPLNEHCSMVLLKKLPEKMGDPGKFLIPCDFSGMDECLALADLFTSINLMPLSVWNKLSLPELSPTCMTFKLVERSISHPVEVAKDVYVKVGTFQFPADFIVVDFDADPRVPLILKRYFLKTERALIDVFEGELTLRVGKEAITFNLDQTSRYSANYNDMTANRIDVIDMACDEYSQEVLGFFDVIASGNPAPYYDPIVSTSSSILIPFRDSDFLLEEVNAFLALEDDPTSPEVDHSYFDP
nr:reverse transcriptase domain-containing protein [Tanacetum cinerariifolium]